MALDIVDMLKNIFDFIVEDLLLVIGTSLAWDDET